MFSSLFPSPSEIGRQVEAAQAEVQGKVTQAQQRADKVVGCTVGVGKDLLNGGRLDFGKNNLLNRFLTKYNQE